MRVSEPGPRRALRAVVLEAHLVCAALRVWSVAKTRVPFAASDPRFEPLVLDDLRVRAGEVVDIGEIRLRLRTPP